jgi:TorA maturation chaperone TorD
MLAAAFSSPNANAVNLYDALLELDASIRTPGAPIELTRMSQSLPTLAREHLRLFVGPGHTPCPPYEAVYRKDRPDFEKGLVMGPSTAAVKRAYLAAGLDLSNTYSDLPDHIAAEMEFMQFLCVEETRLERLGNRVDAAKMKEMQRQFHKDHLETWVADFADCIIRSTTSSFYKAAATVLKNFAKMEADYLGEAV